MLMHGLVEEYHLQPLVSSGASFGSIVFSALVVFFGAAVTAAMYLQIQQVVARNITNGWGALYYHTIGLLPLAIAGTVTGYDGALLFFPNEAGPGFIVRIGLLPRSLSNRGLAASALRLADWVCSGCCARVLHHRYLTSIGQSRRYAVRHV
jgi:hypothetical protein